MQYLVTDPCYTMSDNAWSELLDTKGYDAEDWVGVMTDVGEIIEASSTKYGDGSCSFGNGKGVGVDSGTVCLIRVSEGVTPTEYQGTAVTEKEDVARRWFAKAQQI